MLTDEYVEHYRTFGFVVLRKQLDEQTIAALSQEVDWALRNAFGERSDERPFASHSPVRDRKSVHCSGSP
jgi:hypothetical protein